MKFSQGDPPGAGFYAPGSFQSFLNPGNLTQFHSKSQSIEPRWIDGLNWRLRNARSPDRVIFCNGVLSQYCPSGCRLGVIIRPKDNENESVLTTPIFEAELNPYTIASNVALLYHPIPSFRCKFSTKIRDRTKTESFVSITDISERFSAISAVSCDWFGKSTTISLDAYNLTNNSASLTISYLRNLSNSFAMGMETSVAWTKNQNIVVGSALAARFSTRDTTIAATGSLAPLSLDMSYFHKVNQFIQMGSSVAYNHDIHKAIGAIFWQLDLYDAMVRCKLDSNGCIGISYDRSIQNYDFGFSILFNHKSNNVMCGLKFGCDAPSSASVPTQNQINNKK